MAIENLVKSFIFDVKAYTNAYSLILSASATAIIGYLAYKEHRKNKAQNKDNIKY